MIIVKGLILACLIYTSLYFVLSIISAIVNKKAATFGFLSIVICILSALLYIL